MESVRGQLKNHMWEMHQMGVLHNDVEPRNIVRCNSDLRVIDLGVAEDGHFCGKGTKCTDLLHVVEYIDGEV